MGRYVTGDFEFKFWFAVQSSEDIEEFGGSRIRAWEWSEEDLEIVNKNLQREEKVFINLFKITVDEFLQKIDSKGYQASSHDAETQTKEWEDMCKYASKIELGRAVKKAIEEKGDVKVTYET